MRTVKQVSDLTGISVRALHYYDEIGLLKPSEVTEAGYRLYDDESLKILQQILFFKELDIPLKDVKEIMSGPYFDKMQALENQKKLLLLKRKRLDGLIKLINKTLKGESTMNFKEFDMSEYFNVLEEFKTEHKDKVTRIYGSVDKYNEFIEKCKSNEDKIAKIAIKQYGSIEKYAKAVKKNLNSDMLTLAEKYDEFKKDCLEDNHPKLKELYKKLASDLSKDPSSREIQQIAEEITNTAKKDYEIFKMHNGDDHWYYMVQIYLIYPEWIEAVDKKYGNGASRFIGEALKNCSGTKQPKLEELYKNLASDLSKDPSSKEIQQILEAISDATKKNQDFYKVDEGKNYWGYTAELYLSNPTFAKVTDKKYGNGASKFIGEALKFYSENSKS
ncbi:MerR family transcriptional regulator [Clostridium botulinum]|uniref:MerR family transcriptional regulator n=1 Tax=Clostridium botulinum TaxID=1491 RepID=UPI0013F0B0C0|nr:MerR family transcriptional regulator [Clostridium botulinum]MBY6950359.1 MerR family transcriptional regulator [Clostridium botulinum]MCR1138609.1 MerR family transcriptional regulator [Clostridium botulinum]NEZ80830.1 MerR family transcriptional regulator [Clostridium botulinum]NFA16659.1 MerR family transcriptional regulator [Clostridium botulinum]NFA54771.1 MerR family transcriptional regulator [Clostridium botulinum]